MFISFPAYPAAAVCRRRIHGQALAGYAVAQNIMKVGGDVDPLKPEGQVEISRDLQIATAIIDTAGLCLFVSFPMLDIQDAFNAVVDMVNAKYGLSMNADDVTALGQRILNMERDFNRRAGFTSADDRLPEFFYKEPRWPFFTDFSDYLPSAVHLLSEFFA